MHKATSDYLPLRFLYSISLQPGAVLPTTGGEAMSRDVIAMTGEQGATIWWAEGKDAAEHSTVHRCLPTRMTQAKRAVALRLRNTTLLLQCDTLLKY